MRVQTFVGRVAEQGALNTLITQQSICAVTGDAGVGKTDLVLRVCAAARTRGLVPPLAYVSLTNVGDLDEALRRSWRAAHGRPPTAAVDPATLLAAQAHLYIWDDVDGPLLPALIDACRHIDVGESRLILVARSPVRELPSLAIGPLCDDDADALIAEIDRGRDALRASIARRAGGNPARLRAGLAAARHFIRCGGDRLPVEPALGDAARVVCNLLAVAGTSLPLASIAAVVPDAAAAVGELAARLRADTRDDHIALARQVAADDGDVETWSTLGALAADWLARSPNDARALALAVRVAVRAGDGGEALALLDAHANARRALSADEFGAHLRAIAVATPALAATCVVRRAARLLAGGEPVAALRALDETPIDDPSLTRAASLLRVAAALRTGSPADARRTLVAMTGPDEDGAQALAEAELEIIGGDIDRARDRLERLADRVSGGRELRRTLLIALSYLIEERFDAVLPIVERFEAVADDPFVATAPAVWLQLVKLRALVGLGRIDHAISCRATWSRSHAFARLADENGSAQLAELFIRWHRGQFTDALADGTALDVRLERNGDVLMLLMCRGALARAAMGIGQLDHAETILRSIAGFIETPGLGGMAPLCHLGFMLLSATRCDWRQARRRARAACAAAPSSPFLRADAWWASGAGWDEAQRVQPRRSHAAYLLLRASERALAEDRLATAADHAKTAGEWYRLIGAHFEQCLALLAEAEAQARLGRSAQAQRTLQLLETIARPRDYRIVRIAGLLVRASIADRSGRIGEYVTATHEARLLAGPDLASGALLAACARVGLEHTIDIACEGRPFRDRIVRLGLLRAADRLWTTEDRVYLLAADDPLPSPEMDLVVDVDAGYVRTGHEARPLPRQQLLLLAALSERGDGGGDVEALFHSVWGIDTAFHALRHRNAVYVAVNRVRATLRPLIGRDAIVKRSDGRYAFDGQLRTAVQRDVKRLQRAVDGGAADALDDPNAAEPTVERALGAGEAAWQRARLSCRAPALPVRRCKSDGGSARIARH